jgi:hypothetical protein
MAALAERGVRVPEEMGVGAVTDLRGDTVGKIAPLTRESLQDQPRQEETPKQPE